MRTIFFYKEKLGNYLFIMLGVFLNVYWKDQTKKLKKNKLFNYKN